MGSRTLSVRQAEASSDWRCFFRSVRDAQAEGGVGQGLGRGGIVVENLLPPSGDGIGGGVEILS